MENIITILLYKENGCNYNECYDSDAINFVGIESEQEKLIDAVVGYISSPPAHLGIYYIDILINGVFISGDNISCNIIGSLDDSLFIEQFDKLAHDIYKSIHVKLKTIEEIRKKDKIEREKLAEEHCKQVQKKLEYKEYLKLKKKFENETIQTD